MMDADHSYDPLSGYGNEEDIESQARNVLNGTSRRDRNDSTSPSRSAKMQAAHQRISISNIDINVDDLHRSLNTVNTFATKRLEKLQPILMYEITCDGESVYKHM